MLQRLLTLSHFLGQVIRAKLRVTPQRLPVLMSRHSSNLRNRPAPLEKSGDRLVAQIVRPQVSDAKLFTCAAESLRY
jgi:hypothetical protein